MTIESIAAWAQTWLVSVPTRAPPPKAARLKSGMAPLALNHAMTQTATTCTSGTRSCAGGLNATEVMKPRGMATIRNGLSMPPLAKLTPSWASTATARLAAIAPRVSPCHR